MLRRAFLWCCVAGLGLAQQGHPLTGTWSGDYGVTGAPRTQITVVFNWDGKQVSGVINPGPNAINIGSVYVEPSTWNVRIEADGKDKSGKTIHIAAEGRLDNLGSYHRTIAGSWSEGTSKGDFKIARD